MSRNIKSFTLVEALVVMALVASISLLTMSFAVSQMSGNRLREEARNLESIIYLYQQNAYSGKSGDDHGIKFETGGRYVLFLGDDAGSATTFENVDLAEGISITGVNLSDSSDSIVFPMNSFRPSAYGTITLSDGSEAYNIAINEEGLIYTEQ